MKSSTAYSLLFLPILLMVGHAMLATTIEQHYYRTFDIQPILLLLGLQILIQGTVLVLMYRSLVYKREKNYRILLEVMVVVCILLFILALNQVIPTHLYLVFPPLVAYYGSALLYSLISK